MSKRLMMAIAFLLPLLPLLAYFLLESETASKEITAVERLEPQTAAQLSALPDGQLILIEGQLGAPSRSNLGLLSIYIVEDRYLDADLSGQWMAHQAATPFVAMLPDGGVRVINQDYILKNPLHTLEPQPLQRLTGLALGDRVTIIGVVTHDVGGAAVQARIVAGGTRADYLTAQRTHAARPGEMTVIFALLLSLLGGGLWLIRKQTQRYAHAVI